MMKEIPYILLSIDPQSMVEIENDLSCVNKALKIYTRSEENVHIWSSEQSFEIVNIQDRILTKDGMRIVIEEVLKQANDNLILYTSDGCGTGLDEFANLLLKAAREKNIFTRVVSGDGYLDGVFQQIDSIGTSNIALVDSLKLTHSHVPSFPPTMTGVILGITSQATAGSILANLLTNYPNNHVVTLIGKPTGSESIKKDVLLVDIMNEWQKPYQILVVPSLSQDSSFEAFQELVAHLRAPDGCPWDREQTHASLRANLLEETYEVLAELDQSNWVGLREELGDLLLQILLHTQIAVEEDEFRMPQVIHTICSKLIRRHPHVFGDVQVENVAGVLHNWEVIKANERKMNGESHRGLLDGVPKTYPALAQAQDIQARAARVGFDWSDIAPVLEKVKEELGELQSAETDRQRSDELGDLLFAVVNVSRWLGVEAESALRQANERFRQRFHYIEQKAKEAGRNLKDMTLDEMDVFWEEAKGFMG